MMENVTEQNSDQDYAKTLRDKVKKAKQTCPESATLEVGVDELVQILDRMDSAESLTEAQLCNYSHEDPFDFDYCDTHDKTFEKGGECAYKGISVVNYLDDEMMKQRGRAVIAEENFEDAQMLINFIEGELKTPEQPHERLNSEEILEKIKEHFEKYNYYINYC